MPDNQEFPNLAFEATSQTGREISALMQRTIDLDLFGLTKKFATFGQRIDAERWQRSMPLFNAGVLEKNGLAKEGVLLVAAYIRASESAKICLKKGGEEIEVYSSIFGGISVDVFRDGSWVDAFIFRVNQLLVEPNKEHIQQQQLRCFQAVPDIFNIG